MEDVQITLKVNGEIYNSPVSYGMDLVAAKDNLYATLDSTVKFEMELEDGGYLLVGPDVVRNCVIILKDVSTQK